MNLPMAEENWSSDMMGMGSGVVVLLGLSVDQFE